MPNKRALIVDDSKTAQFKLKKILSDFELSIDSVFSAEDALSYLSYQVPDIIFMDHSMKGMSGLDAVKIIKLNPVTAVIPVVMYTAEKGDVYVSQARAVGAMEVLSKDMVTVSDIVHVMRSAKIILKPKQGKIPESDATRLEKIKEVVPPKPVKKEVTIKPTEVSASLIDVRNQVSRALELQQSKIQRDIKDSSRMITRRLMHEVRELHTTFKQQHKESPVTVFSDLVDSLEPPKQRNFLWYLLPMLLLLGSVGYGVYQINSLKQENSFLVAENQKIVNSLAEQNSNILASIKRLELSNRTGIDSDYLFEEVLPAANQDKMYAFGSLAIDAQRIAMLERLLVILDQSGFKGAVYLYINTGNFCVATNSSGEFVLPESGSRLSDCELMEYYYPDPSLIKKTISKFNQMMSANPILIRSDITVSLVIENIYSDNESYPDFDESTPASDWNDAALRNNTVVIDLDEF